MHVMALLRKRSKELQETKQPAEEPQPRRGKKGNPPALPPAPDNTFKQTYA